MAMATLQPAARPFGCVRWAIRDITHQQTRAPRRFITTKFTPRKERLEFPKNLPQAFKEQITPRLRPGYVPRQITVHPPPPKTECKEPLKDFTEDQLATLDPTGERRKLFDRENREGIKPGDILRVTMKNGQPFSGVCLNIRSRGVDTAFLLRNKLASVNVEMWLKVFSPNVQSVELVQRSQKKIRRERLTYMRKPKHDLGSVESIVTQYIKKKAAMRGGETGRYRVIR